MFSFQERSDVFVCVALCLISDSSSMHSKMKSGTFWNCHYTSQHMQNNYFNFTITP